MGILDLSCLVLNGTTQLLGLSLAVPESEFLNGSSSSNHTAVILLELSSPHPATMDDLRSFTVKSIWPKNLVGLQIDNLAFQCHVDPLTGVFSAVHSYNDLSGGGASLSFPPGGFQYNPRTDTWSDIAFSLDYKWNGDPSSSFALFTWPNTTTLFQATIGNSSTINIGMLDPMSTSAQSATFVNYFNWTLDANQYGYPRRVAFGGDSVYQIGSIITNADTGTQDVMITRIALTANSTAFYPPSNLPVVSSPMLDDCGAGLSTASTAFYSNTLYLFCSNTTLGQRVPYSVANYPGYLLKYQESGGSLIGTYNSSLDIRYVFLGSPFVAMPRNGNETDQWCVSMSLSQTVTIGLDGINFGNVSQGQGLNAVNTPYGQPADYDSEPNWKAIIGGSVTGALVVLLLVTLALRRWLWPKWRNVYWPSLRERIKAKLLYMLTQEDSQRDLGEYGDKRVLQEDGEDDYKLEEISMHSLDGSQGKILVTEDMELELNGPVLTIDTAYMGGVALESHPRPTYVTVLADETHDHPSLSIPPHNPADATSFTPSSQRRRNLQTTAQSYAQDNNSMVTTGSGDSNSINNNGIGSYVHHTPNETLERIPPLQPLPSSHRLVLPSAPPNPSTNGTGD